MMSDIRKKRRISDGIRGSEKTIKRTRKKTRSFPDSAQPQKLSVQLGRKKAKKVHKSHSQVRSRKVQKNRNFFTLISQHRKLIKWLVFIAVYCLILVFIFNKFEKTKISITPRAEYISESSKVKIYKHPKFDQLGFGIISLSDSQEKTIAPKQSVQVSEKSSGLITVFNNYSTEPQKLSPLTRFKSVSGKVFKLDSNSIIIPGKTATSPGKIEVMIYAEKTGPDYNIDVTDFTIPGFQESGLSEKYQNIYALSLKPFTGGSNGQQLVVSEKQKTDAQDSIEFSIKEMLLEKLNREKTDKVIMVDNSIQIVFKKPILKKTSDNNFTLKQDAQIFGIFVEKTQLEKFLKQKYLPDEFDKDMYVSSFDKIAFDYKGDEINFKNINTKNIDMILDFNFIWNVDEMLVRESLVGLGKDNVPVILRELGEIQSAKIKIRPFWKKSISDNLERIKINVEE